MAATGSIRREQLRAGAAAKGSPSGQIQPRAGLRPAEYEAEEAQMLPRAWSVTNFRSFRDPATLQLRPITLVYGQNNVGKSWLVRSLVFLSQSLRGGPPTLDVEGPGSRDSAFADHVWKGPSLPEASPSVRLRLDWTADLPARAVEWTLTATGRPNLRQIAVEAGSSAHRGFSADYDPESPEPDGEGPWGMEVWHGEPFRSRSERRAFTFRGLTPSCEALGITAEVADQLASLRACTYLTSPHGRSVAVPILPEPGARPDWSPLAGNDVLRLLRAEASLTSRVSAWFERPPKGAPDSAGRRLGFEPVAPGYFRPYLELRDSSVRVPLADSGAGWNQVLPVFAGLALMQRPTAPPLFVVEEPEAGLHPNAQRRLAEALIETAKARPDARLVLETHSWPLLQYLLLSVVKGELPPAALGIHWVHQGPDAASRVDLVEVGADGLLDAPWPADAFTDSLTLAREIQQARRGR